MKYIQNLRHHFFSTLASQLFGMTLFFVIAYVTYLAVTHTVNWLEGMEQGYQVVFLTPRSMAAIFSAGCLPFILCLTLMPCVKLLESDDTTGNKTAAWTCWLAVACVPLIVLLTVFGRYITTSHSQQQGYSHCANQKGSRGEIQWMYFTNDAQCPDLKDMIALRQHHQDTGVMLTHVNQLPGKPAPSI